MNLKAVIIIAVLVFVVGLAIFFLVYPVGLTPPAIETLSTKKITSLVVSSPAFEAREEIPEKYACDGLDVSPPLSWEGYPAETKSFVIIMEDPDAPGGTFIHWVVYNVPVSVNEFPEEVPAEDRLENGAYQGINDFGRIGYGGPCPPPGETHRYIFRVYALDTVLELPPGATNKEVLSALEGHIVGEGSLTGIYRR